MGILDFFKRKKKEEKKPEEDTITGYELYECPPGGKWRKILDSETEIDFADVEDAKPAYTYKFCSRTTRGLIRSIWYEHIPGTEQPKVVNPFESLTQLLKPMKEFGEQINAVRNDIREAFGWAFPEKTGEGGAEIPPLTFKGELPAYMHPSVPKLIQAWTPVLGDMGKSIGSGIKEGFMGGAAKEEGKEEKKVEFKRPPPSPDDFLKKEEPAEKVE